MLMVWLKKYCLIIYGLFLCLLMACQSPQQIAGSDHKLVVDKWNALSKYAYGVLNRYDISIGATLSIDKTYVNKKFKLTDFTLLHKANASQIDLLLPSFEQKIICAPECSLVTEYMVDSSVNATLLKQYFDDAEFKLFKFYGDLVLLEGTLKSLEELDADLFSAYLKWLIAQNERFNSLGELTLYLNSNLSQSEFLTFTSDPTKLYSLLELDNSLDTASRFRSDIIDEDIQFQAAELANIEAEFILTEQDDWQENVATIVESEFWPESTTRSDGIVTTITSNDLDWPLLKDLEISLGDQVCSYQENYFGLVTETVGNRFSVYVLGQLQSENDNILMSAAKGAVFNQIIQGGFVTIKENIVLSNDNLAPCNITLLNQ